MHEAHASDRANRFQVIDTAFYVSVAEQGHRDVFAAISAWKLSPEATQHDILAVLDYLIVCAAAALHNDVPPASGYFEDTSATWLAGWLRIDAATSAHSNFRWLLNGWRARHELLEYRAEAAWLANEQLEAAQQRGDALAAAAGRTTQGETDDDLNARIESLLLAAACDRHNKKEPV